MAVRVVPTLQAMAEVYQQSASGGPSSPRFHAYVELGRQRRPVSGYNPMTSQPTLPTIEALLDLDAEALIQEVMAATASTLRIGSDGDVVVSLTVATPGMWTDRLATEIEHRFLGRTVHEVVLWCGEPVDAARLSQEAAAQTVRIAWARHHGAPRSLADAAGQEGLAATMSVPEDSSAGGWDQNVAEALEVLGDDEGLGTKVAVLHGDDAARAMGWTSLGIEPNAGYAHCAAAARAALVERSPAELLHDRWTPPAATDGGGTGGAPSRLPSRDVRFG